MSDLRVTCAGPGPSSLAASGRQLFRRGAVPARDERALRRRAALRRPRARGARGRRLPRPAAGGRRPRPGAHAARRGADLQRLPAPPGGDAARPRQHRQQHRLPAAPLDLRPASGAADRRAALRRRPLPEPAQLPAAGPGTACCSRRRRRQRPRRRGRPGRPRPARRPRLHRLRASTASSCTSATTTGRPSSRSTSRTTTSARSIPGLGQLRHLRGPALGVRPHYSVQTVGVAQRAGASPARRCTSSWHDALLQVPRRRAARSTARSGSPTTRT